MGSRHIPKQLLPVQQAPSTPVSTSWKLWHPDRGFVFSASTAAASPAVVLRAALPQLLPARPANPLHVVPTPNRPIHTAAAALGGLEDGPESVLASLLVGGEAAGASKQNGVEAAKKEDVEERDGKPDEVKEADLPVTTLPFKMPLDLFRKARKAAPNSPESFWTYELYRHVGDDARVKVHYCKSQHTTERVCKQYFADEPILGFDLEWQASAMRWQSARHNVCLVQLASPSRIGLFHLAVYPAKDGLVAPTLQRILEDPAVIKMGVCIRGDATRLRTFLQIEARGLLELSHLHKLVKYSRSGETALVNKKLVPLATQVQEHLGLPMFKGQDVRSGDWSKPLRMDQIIYSASDAYAGLQIYSVLEQERENLKPTPPRPAYAELGIPIQLADRANTAGVEDSDDPSEDMDETETSDSGQTSTLSTEFLAKAGEQVEIETDEGESVTETPRPKSVRKRTSSSSPASAAKSKDARVVAADEWAARYRISGLAVRARPACLRAYHLWHGDEQLDAATVASLLREPPLQTSTVVSYILEAVRLERLPYKKERMRAELLDQIPQSVVMLRHRRLAQACGYDWSAAKTEAEET